MRFLEIYLSNALPLPGSAIKRCAMSKQIINVLKTGYYVAATTGECIL
jgi:hypothetical protein